MMFAKNLQKTVVAICLMAVLLYQFETHFLILGTKIVMYFTNNSPYPTQFLANSYNELSAYYGARADLNYRASLKAYLEKLPKASTTEKGAIEYALGSYYLKGHGVTRNLKKANYYFNLSKSHGFVCPNFDINYFPKQKCYTD